MVRKKLRIGNMQQMIFDMSEGNPGAVRVLMELIQGNEFGLMDILNLDDMNMRGSQIWVAYKDHCGQNLEKFRSLIQIRDEAMIATVNESMGHAPNTPQAVTSGASYQHVA